MGAVESKHDVFHAIADPTRRQLLRLLAGNELAITSITEHFSVSRTAVNKHLHVLSAAGLVTRNKVGRETRYKLEAAPLQELEQWLQYFEQFWDNKMALLKNYLESEID